jgi:hypothetical protein
MWAFTLLIISAMWGIGFITGMALKNDIMKCALPPERRLVLFSTERLYEF